MTSLPVQIFMGPPESGQFYVLPNRTVYVLATLSKIKEVANGIGKWGN